MRDIQEQFPPIPSTDSANNNTVADVVGNKSDTYAGDSIFSHVHIMLEHGHSPSQVYPTLAAGTTVVSSAVAWTLGNFVIVVPASTVGLPFDIHYVSIEDLSANGVYELVLYYGAGDTECGRVRFTKNAVQDGTMNVPMQTILIPADSIIKAKLATDNAVANTADISLFYHTY